MKKFIYKKLYTKAEEFSLWHKKNIDGSSGIEKQLYMFGWAYWRQLALLFWCNAHNIPTTDEIDLQ